MKHVEVGAMKRVTLGLAALVVAGTLAWVSGATGQTQQPAPAAPPSAAPAGMEKTIEGQVKSVDPSGRVVTLADGTQLMIPATVRVSRTELKPGATVKVSYEEKDGQNIVKSLEVQR